MIEFAKSLSGHDKDRMYLIWKKEERFAYLVDGKTHTVANPKKKNVRHYQVIKHLPEQVRMRFPQSGPITDDVIRGAVREYERSINK